MLKQSLKGMNPLVLSLVAGIIPVIAGLVTAILTYKVQTIQESESERDKQELLAKNDIIRNELIEKYREIARLNSEYSERVNTYAEAQIKSSDEIKALNQQLVKRAEKQANLQEELRKKSDELYNFSFGGDSFCYAVLSFAGGSSSNIYIYPEGKYPLYEAIVKFWDEEQMIRLMKETQDKLPSDVYVKGLESITKSVSLGTLAPFLKDESGAVQMVATIPYRDSGEYNFIFYARNGTWQQNLKIYKGEVSYIVWKYKGEKVIVLKKDIQASLPLSEYNDLLKLK